MEFCFDLFGCGYGCYLHILKEFHEGTHEGVLKTYKRLRAVFYWFDMHKSVMEFIQQCDVSQWSKSASMYGLLQPLSVPTHLWSDISMDFITGLPKSQGKDVVMVVVDRLSKSAHFVALHHPFITVASLFFDNVLKLHGMPASIVCNRDPTFTSDFWNEFTLQGIAFNYSSAYHPQTDGHDRGYQSYFGAVPKVFHREHPMRGPNGWHGSNFVTIPVTRWPLR